MIAMAFWESSVEGRNAWNKNKNGWKIRAGKYVVLTRYHLWVWIMWLLLIYLPILINGWDSRLFGILLSALFSGFIIEDSFFCPDFFLTFHQTHKHRISEIDAYM